MVCDSCGKPMPGDTAHSPPGPATKDGSDPLFSYLRPSPAQANACLCPECTDRQRLTDSAERIYADYTREAEGASRWQSEWLDQLKTLALVTAAVDFVLLFVLRQETLFVVWCLVTAVAGCAWAAAHYLSKRRYLALTAERNPSFAEFHRAWRMNRELHNRPFAESGALGEIAFRIAADAAKAEQQARPAGNTDGSPKDPNGR